MLDVPLAAGSTHTLRLTYNLALPASPPGGSYPPSLTWTAGPRLTFNFGFTDLVPGRYLEAWVPANLIWDQYALNLDLQVTGTAVPHRLLTNGALTPLGANHWRVLFPDRFTALSPLVELRADDTLTSASTTVTLPVSGQTMTIEAWKLTVNTALNLATQLGEPGRLVNATTSTPLARICTATASWPSSSREAWSMRAGAHPARAHYATKCSTHGGDGG